MRKLASIQTVNAVEPIPNADVIEKIRVLGWWVVVTKGEHLPGDKLVYCEIDSLLAERAEFEFLRASSFKPAQMDAAVAVALPAGFRIKTVRLRGQVSLGICFPLSILPPGALTDEGGRGYWITDRAYTNEENCSLRPTSSTGNLNRHASYS